MAFKLKHWFLVVVGGSALIAATELPPELVEIDSGFDRRTPERIRYETINRALFRLSTTILQQTAIDSLAGAAEGRRVFIFGSDGPVASQLSTGQADSITEHFRDYLAKSSGGSNEVEVLLFSGDHPSIAGRATLQRSAVTILPSSGQATPSCIRVVSSWQLRWNLRSPENTARDLGECDLYYRMGLPGSVVGLWLSEAAFQYGSWSRYKEYTNVCEGSFGWFGTQCIRPDVMACRRGIASRCATVFLEGRPLTSRGFSLLANLEDQFGSEAFQRFWKSELEVPQAFEAAFGIPLGYWLVEWAQNALGPVEASTRITGSTWALSLLTLTLMAGVAGIVANRKRLH